MLLCPNDKYLAYLVSPAKQTTGAKSLFSYTIYFACTDYLSGKSWGLKMDMCATNRHFMINNASISLLVLSCICISLYSYGNGMLLGHIDSIRRGRHIYGGMPWQSYYWMKHLLNNPQYSVFTAKLILLWRSMDIKSRFNVLY